MAVLEVLELGLPEVFGGGGGGQSATGEWDSGPGPYPNAPQRSATTEHTRLTALCGGSCGEGASTGPRVMPPGFLPREITAQTRSSNDLWDAHHWCPCSAPVPRSREEACTVHLRSSPPLPCMAAPTTPNQPQALQVFRSPAARPRERRRRPSHSQEFSTEFTTSPPHAHTTRPGALHTAAYLPSLPVRVSQVSLISDVATPPAPAPAPAPARSGRAATEHAHARELCTECRHRDACGLRHSIANAVDTDGPSKRTHKCRAVLQCARVQ